MRQARESKEDYADFLLALSELEVAARMENGCKRRIRDARFPLLKPIEDFSSLESAPELDGPADPRVFLEDDTSGRPAMSSCWAGAAREKTHLATAPGDGGVPAKGWRTRFVTGCSLANELIEGPRRESPWGRVIKRYASYDLLIVDELGYVPPLQGGRPELLFSGSR